MNKEKRLRKIAPNNRAMILAYDQGFEHGPRDFLKNPNSADFRYILELAQLGGFTGLVVHAGLAEKKCLGVQQKNKRSNFQIK